MPKKKQKIFISYAKEDAVSARLLRQDLADAGADTWLDSEDLLGGSNWRLAIGEAIRECSHFVALLSSKSVSKRGYVQKELKTALDVLDEFPEGDVFIIPVRLDDCRPTSHRLCDLHWVDMFPDWTAGVRKILKTLGIQSQSARQYHVSTHRKSGGQPRHDKADSSALHTAHTLRLPSDLYIDGAKCVKCGNPIDVIATPDGTPEGAVCDMCGMMNLPQHLGRIPTPFGKVMSSMPELIAEMKADLAKPEFSLLREFFIVSRGSVLNVRDPCFIYYFDDHPNLQAKIHILENYGYVTDVTPGNAKKYRMTEEFVELVLST